MSRPTLDAAIDILVRKALDATNHDRLGWTRVSADEYFAAFPGGGRLTLHFEAARNEAGRDNAGFGQVRLTVSSPEIEPYDIIGPVLSYFTAPGGPGDLRGPVTRAEVVGQDPAKIVELFEAVERQPARQAELAAQQAEDPRIQAITEAVEAMSHAL